MPVAVDERPPGWPLGCSCDRGERPERSAAIKPKLALVTSAMPITSGRAVDRRPAA
jgi:hypothetical protein